MLGFIVFPLVIIAGLAAGTCLALMARSELMRDSKPYQSRYFAITALFGVGILTPAGLIIWALYPDWALMYWMNPVHLPTIPLGIGIGALYAAAAPGGFVVARRLDGLLRPRPKQVWIAALGIGTLGVIALGWARLGSVSYYETFHYGVDATSLGQSALLVPLIGLSLIVSATFGFMAWRVRHHLQLTRYLPDHDAGTGDTAPVP